MKELQSLIKNLDNLVVVVIIYLMITWGYQGLEFIVETLASVLG